MEAINIRQLKLHDLISFYSAEEEAWLTCQITQLGLNFVHLHALEGNITGFRWTENLRTIQDPEHYRVHIPEPPKRKRKWFTVIRNFFRR